VHEIHRIARRAVRPRDRHRAHIEKETAAVLPFAREALEASERVALGERMAARRKS
jgi:hypothetical protein